MEGQVRTTRKVSIFWKVRIARKVRIAMKVRMGRKLRIARKFTHRVGIAALSVLCKILNWFKLKSFDNVCESNLAVNLLLHILY